MCRFLIVHASELPAFEEFNTAYINFTDGLATALELGKIRARNVVVTRMRSSHLEIGEWEEFIRSVPDDMIYRLVTGQRLLFIDSGSRRRDGVPRTIWQGLPLLLHVIHKVIWGYRVPPPVKPALQTVMGPHYARTVDIQVAKVSKEINKKIRARIRYWRRYATPDPQYVLVATYTKAALERDESVKIELSLRHKI